MLTKAKNEEVKEKLKSTLYESPNKANWNMNDIELQGGTAFSGLAGNVEILSGQSFAESNNAIRMSSSVHRKSAAVMADVIDLDYGSMKNIAEPTSYPSAVPTVTPSSIPTVAPSMLPTASPSSVPTSSMSTQSVKSDTISNGNSVNVNTDPITINNNNNNLIDDIELNMAVTRKLTSNEFDLVNIPQLLDTKLNKNNLLALRANNTMKYNINENCNKRSITQANIIHPSDNWYRERRYALVSKKIATEILSTNELKSEKEKVFDLLHGLTNSGAYLLDQVGLVTLHVITSTTHHFDNTLINSIIKDNVNPIDDLDETLLILASTIYNTNIANLTKTIT